jgi:hypothetical protein
MNETEQQILWTPLKLGQCMNRHCASEGCGQQPTERFESGDVGSDYCAECADKIKAHIKRWDALPPELLPCVPGEVVVVCPCGQEWKPATDDVCPNCCAPLQGIN